MSKGGVDEEAAALSPKSRLKFLCSYGGKILPRPTDGQLKYVGGETRILSVPRSVTFKELKEKIAGMFNNTEVVIKYQVFPEDLDALVSVRTDEDLYHMLEEYDRHESLPRSPSSSTRFRIFLFRTTSAATPTTSSPTYLDAINGGSVSMKDSLGIAIPSKPPIFTASSSSVCSSPDSSPIHYHGQLSMAVNSGQPGLSRVRSTPNLSAGSLSQMANGSGSTIGSPRAGGSSTPHHYYPQYQQPPQLQQLPQHKGMMGYGGGGMSRMGSGPHRHETFGHGPMSSGHHNHNQNQRRYYYPPFGGNQWGYFDDSHTPEGVPRSFNMSGGRTPPVVPPKKCIWE